MTPSRSAGGRTAGVGLLAVLPLLWGCTEDPLTAVDPDEAPGPRTETREVRLDVESLPVWRDTSVSGFALPGDGGFLLLATREELQARTLARFSEIPDSVSLFGDTLFMPVDSFANVSLFVRMDTVASTFPPFPFTLRAHVLQRPFDARSVTWAEAASGEPWTTPGGDLGPVLGSFVVEEIRDTLSLTFEVPEDSLLKAWRASDGEPGIALRVEESGARIRFTSLVLDFDALAEDVANPFSRAQTPSPGSFIFTPPQPQPGLRLRVGGLPAWRYYLEFRLPESVDGIVLRDAVVSHAELVFHPLEPPPDPFVPSSSLAAQGIQLLGDPFELGPRTPIGGGGSSLILRPDSLLAGKPLRLDVTDPVSSRLRGDDPSAPIRIGIRGTPDGQRLGFWEFGSVEHRDPALRPVILLVLSPPPSFGVP